MQSSRRAEIQKEQSLKSLEKSLAVWLNFLFENPRSCGCDLSVINGDSGYTGGSGDSYMVGTGKGKRECARGTRDCVVGIDGAWRSPKRLRDSWWQVEEKQTENAVSFRGSKYSMLSESLKEVCSFDDLRQRMRICLSLGCCREIFDVMAQVIKNIDDGRIKMKPHCPIVTDVGMKERAIRTLMCYNPTWLRIALYIIFGGDSLLSNVDDNSEQERAFLKMVIEKQFLSHAGLAKAYAYNKNVEGLYRPGYYESLGKIILKRVLLLVLILDRAKSLSSLPLQYGIDGKDGGSPLLFLVKSSIKSSCQLIHEFLPTDIMHGEGDLLAHLGIVGYEVPFQQCPLIEFDFRVVDLFVDLQDGVRLCRAIQLLQHDPSILMKVVAPSDSRKKNLANCGVVLQYLRKAGVLLHDDDGLTIMEDDIVNGDKELTLAMLWNMFVHLQLPLLINKTIIHGEICKFSGLDEDHQNNISCAPLEMLLNWIKAISGKYDIGVENFSSLVDGKAIWCLLDFYFRREYFCPCLCKEDSCKTKGEQSVVSTTDHTDAVHNFILSQKLTALLGNFPEVLQISDLLEYNGPVSDRSVMILLAFLASQLTIKENMDRLNFHKLLCGNCQALEKRHSRSVFVSSKAAIDKEERKGQEIEDAAKRFKAIQAWWQEMTQQNCNYLITAPSSTQQHFLTRRGNINIQKENAATIIQSHIRRFIDRHKFMKMMNAISLLQICIRLWLKVKQKARVEKFDALKDLELACERWRSSDTLVRYTKFFVDRHDFIKVRRSILLIQKATRIWLARRYREQKRINHDASTPDQMNNNIAIPENNHGWKVRTSCDNRNSQMVKASALLKEKGLRDLEVEAAVKIQLSWKKFTFYKVHNQNLSATKIQSYFRGWLVRKRFLNQKLAITRIQSDYRCLRCLRTFQQYKSQVRSAILIQSHVRGWFARKEAQRYKYFIIVIQRYYRGWVAKKDFLLRREAAKRIQSTFRWLEYKKSFHHHKHAAIEIQRFIRGQIARKRLLGPSCKFAAITNYKFHISGSPCQDLEMKIVVCSVLKLQRWWKNVMSLKSRSAAIIIQRHIRGWIAKQKASRKMHSIILIQSYWRGYIVRKESREELLDLRLRMQKSATNVDDSKRIINKLLLAVTELRNMKSVRGILHTCATLDNATRLSQKCCEELVAAGAIDILLTLIHSVSRSIPDQEVLKHALSTIRNLVRYPHLTEVLINSQESVETITWELLRNKEEGYFIASEILKKMCSNAEGIEAVHRFPALVKRLHNLVEELSRKTTIDKRNTRVLAARGNAGRRLKEAVEVLKLITDYKRLSSLSNSVCGDRRNLKVIRS